jgi:phosphoglucosamine mutase
MRKVAQTTVNVRVSGGAAALVADAGVQAAYERVRAELEGQGRVVLRPSGTEPLVRVTIEAGDAALVERLAAELADAVKSAASTTTTA